MTWPPDQRELTDVTWTLQIQYEPDCCGAEPPQDGTWGDCWCTLPPNHDGNHLCQPCTDRHGAPGWTDQPAAIARQDGAES